MQYVTEYFETGYNGITLTKDYYGYYLSASNGEEQAFTCMPTRKEIEAFVDSLELY